MRVLAFDAFGGPEVLTVREMPAPALADGHALVRTRALGMNFADVYRRKGNYTIDGAPPYVCGYEGAGVVEEVRGSSAVKMGDRVAFADVPRANAELVAAPVDKLVPLPDAIDFDTAAALMLQGLTAQYLVSDSYAVKSGDVALVHAAAGGVGLLLVQMCRARGARVVGMTSSREKAEKALALGCEKILSYTNDWPDQARAFAGGRGVDVAYDSVGATLDGSLTAARVGGAVVFYGMAGGDPAPVDPRRLMDESKTLTGGDLWNVLTSRQERIARSARLFDDVRTGRLVVTIAARVPLADGAEAHRLLESRGTIGKVLLVP